MAIGIGIFGAAFDTFAFLSSMSDDKKNKDLDDRKFQDWLTSRGTLPPLIGVAELIVKRPIDNGTD